MGHCLGHEVDRRSGAGSDAGPIFMRFPFSMHRLDGAPDRRRPRFAFNR
jgi:hypothetical protein